MDRSRCALASIRDAHVPGSEPVPLAALTLVQRRVVVALLEAEQGGRTARPHEPHATTSVAAVDEGLIDVAPVDGPPRASRILDAARAGETTS
jgi:hypothetical protein